MGCPAGVERIRFEVDEPSLAVAAYASVRYAWQVTAMFPQPMALAVFSGGEQMTLIDRTAASSHGAQQLVFDAVAGTRYLIAAGVHASEAMAAIPAGPIVFTWGPPPANDDHVLAASLTGASGRAPGSTEFAGRRLRRHGFHRAVAAEPSRDTLGRRPASGGVDAFGSGLPHFRLGQGIAVSPDQRHIYATQPGQLLVFERTGQS